MCIIRLEKGNPSVDRCDQTELSRGVGLWLSLKEQVVSG